MQKTARALFVMAALLAVCAALITAASWAATSRPSISQTGLPPRSVLEASYAPDGDLPGIAPLSLDVVQAATEDRRALGLSIPAPASEDPARQAQSGDVTASELTPGSSQGTEAVPADTGSEAVIPVKDSNQGFAGARSIPLTAILVGMLAVVLCGWGAVYLLRPQKD